MKSSAVFREAGLNILSGTTRFVLFSVILFLVGTALIVADHLVVSQDIAEGQRFHRSGLPS